MNKLAKGTKIKIKYMDLDQKTLEKNRKKFEAMHSLKKALLPLFPVDALGGYGNSLSTKSRTLARQTMITDLISLKLDNNSTSQIQVSVNKRVNVLPVNSTLKSKLEVIKKMVDEELAEKRTKRAEFRNMNSLTKDKDGKPRERAMYIQNLSTNDLRLSFPKSAPGSTRAGKVFQVNDKAWSTFRIQRTGSPRYGYVHVNSGDILRLKEAHKVKKIFEAKRPRTNEHHLGIEIEFFCDWNRDQLAQELVDINQYLELKTDGSVRPTAGKHGHELVLCVPESKREEIVNKVCEVLKAANSKINESCGLHVHLDVRNRNRDLVYSNLVAAQNVLFGILPPSRRTNDYCKPNNSRVFSRELEGGDRYRGINPQSYQKHKTLEVRMHSGTTNAEKINNWVQILETIARKDEEVVKVPQKVNTFSKYFGIDEKLQKYMETRSSRFISEKRDEEAVGSDEAGRPRRSGL